MPRSRLYLRLEDRDLGKVYGTVEEGLVKLRGIGEFRVGHNSYVVYPSKSKHVCGAQGFGARDSDSCPACMHRQRVDTIMRVVEGILQS